ncbi:phosphonate C-P lyase system protein PhnG [Phreatobacter cathodiphilus]|uniref:Phosphonate C-P lyase system protein PhnG n=1 Tax=Phreatobacter cathodiphilus TaxID=1868589 RepID=A0A2S0NDC2_9HYPH|nr:phosphonate C-P lyase system protein PhnG [Phreatobacter cathodiphilus]AVO45931.1 phosphonate C-P lyase system protein PhnG [Phreatobacter cathodiphilus]
MTDRSEPTDSLQTARKATMATVARATVGELAALETLAGEGAEVLRAPEIGLVMVRGRIGGDGAPFNLGEATVTRAAISLPGGVIGFGHVLGRDREKARLAALADALWQAPATREAVETLLAPVRDRIAAEAVTKRERAAATRVDFFTMVRGDN